MTLIEHKGLGLSTELKDLTQRDLERFYAKQREIELKPEIYEMLKNEPELL